MENAKGERSQYSIEAGTVALLKVSPKRSAYWAVLVSAKVRRGSANFSIDKVLPKSISTKEDVIVMCSEVDRMISGNARMWIKDLVVFGEYLKGSETEIGKL